LYRCRGSTVSVWSAFIHLEMLRGDRKSIVAHLVVSVEIFVTAPCVIVLLGEVRLECRQIENPLPPSRQKSNYTTMGYSDAEKLTIRLITAVSLNRSRGGSDFSLLGILGVYVHRGREHPQPLHSN